MSGDKSCVGYFVWVEVQQGPVPLGAKRSRKTTFVLGGQGTYTAHSFHVIQIQQYASIWTAYSQPTTSVVAVAGAVHPNIAIIMPCGCDGSVLGVVAASG